MFINELMVENTLGSLLADALATAAFILGLEEGLKLVKRYGTEALFVDEKRNIYLTPQLKEYFYSSNGHSAWLK